ncbi:hypothetical protein ERO13_D04G121000v2 [Gossypium hirsutum]|uniref:Cyclin-dependent protein kinase inhibitor SMR3 n=4 Tax=Gossypium TaxID=3633 RepID=A0A0D2TM53_GOSRA|nr:cyclin-dependent protein kinase inhibitor SMR3 isoform X2 [Gossypium raimondii]KAG4152421.1 hypothetical protein ERO13_D04G121000v2 [Gossypium hirsutum]KJB76728.1 hypothetical protein B456_012G103600 [Gossypium raimondii]TYI87525.1 hypothetical protein E1A91_D04G141900v1 [Gossypium mustelinum]
MLSTHIFSLISLILMYAEFSQISLLTMSNSELILVNKDDDQKRIVKRPPLEFQDECCCEATAIYNYPSNDIPGDDDREPAVVQDDEEKKGIEKDKKKHICSGELKVRVDDDDDGFKTPTSMDHKIPEKKQCPPAPRKPKANKRKASPSASICSVSEEVESWFAASLVDDLHRKMKKARTQENGSC